MLLKLYLSEMCSCESLMTLKLKIRLLLSSTGNDSFFGLYRSK